MNGVFKETHSLPDLPLAFSHARFIDASGILASVAAMIATLLLMVLVVICVRCTMPKWTGGLFLILYSCTSVLALVRRLRNS